MSCVLGNLHYIVPMSWEERYQVGDTPWDKGAAAPPLIDLLQESPAYFGSETILVPGCGRGHDARAIAKAIPTAQTIGLDISVTALKLARTLDPDSQVEFQQVDFLTEGSFPHVSAIFEHTCFCAIDPSLRPSYAEACARLLPAGAHWIAIIFLTPRDIDDPTIGPPFQSSVPEITELFSPHFNLIESYRPKNTYAGRKGKELVMIWQRK